MTKKKADPKADPNTQTNYSTHHTNALQWLEQFDQRLRSRQGVTRDEFRQARELRQVLRGEGIDV